MPNNKHTGQRAMKNTASSDACSLPFRQDTKTLLEEWGYRISTRKDRTSSSSFFLLLFRNYINPQAHWRVQTLVQSTLVGEVLRTRCQRFSKIIRGKSLVHSTKYTINQCHMISLLCLVQWVHYKYQIIFNEKKIEPSVILNWSKEMMMMIVIKGCLIYFSAAVMKHQSKTNWVGNGLF